MQLVADDGTLNLTEMAPSGLFCGISFNKFGQYDRWKETASPNTHLEDVELFDRAHLHFALHPHFKLRRYCTVRYTPRCCVTAIRHYLEFLVKFLGITLVVHSFHGQYGHTELGVELGSRRVADRLVGLFRREHA